MQRSLAPQRAWALQVAVAGAPSAPRGGGGGGGPSSLRASGASGGAPRRVSPRRASSQDGAAPAWSALLGRELPMEGLVRQVLSLIGSSAAFTRRRDADARTHGGTEVENAWLVRLQRCIAAIEAQLICSHARLHAG